MGRFGKKVEISISPLDYNIAILGESGIGKSTIVKQMCEKLVGDEGYISLDIGKEDGHKAISGIISEKVPDWATFKEIVNDIIENKETDYPKLKVVVIDTYDQFCEIAEREAVRLYNKVKPSDKPKAETINSAWGGFGKGLDKTIEIMLDSLWELKKVGVNFIIIAHVKRTDVTDITTEEKYTMLTSNTTQKYFNAIKQKLDFLGMAYIDREIIKVKTTKKDNNGNYIEKGKLAGESRVISFRDDNYCLDSKCRFANIVDKIPFDVDAFIKAMQDAILAEQKKDGISLEDAKKKQAEEEKEREKKAAEYSKEAREMKVDPERNEELVDGIKEKFAALGDEDKELKAKVKAAIIDLGLKNFGMLLETPTKQVEEIYNLFA